MNIFIDDDKIVIAYGDGRTPCFLFPCLSYHPSGTTTTKVKITDRDGKAVNIDPVKFGFTNAQNFLDFLKDANAQLCSNTSASTTMSKKVVDSDQVCVPLLDGTGDHNLIRLTCDDGTIYYKDFNDNLITNLTIYDMSKSTAFVPKKDNEVVLERYLTDCVTGKVTPVCLVKNLTDKTSNMYLEDGTMYEGPAPEAGVLELGPNPVPVPLGNLQIDNVEAATDLEGAGLVCPENAQFGFVEPSGGDIIYTLDGTAPDGTSDPIVGIRVADGGRICIYGKKALGLLQIAPLDGTGPVDINIEFKNILENGDD